MLRLALTAAFLVLPLPVTAGDLHAVARRAFSCPPLLGLPGDSGVEPRRPKTRRHRVPALGLSLRLPKGWRAPSAPTSFAAEAESPDGRTTARARVERLDGRGLREAVALHEGRSFGPSAASEACSEALLARYGWVAGDAALGFYRSRLAYRGHTSAWVLFVVRDGALVTLTVESRWTERHGPDQGAVDAILSGLRWL